LDADWVQAGTRRYTDYRALRPGDYVFQVKGTNNDGVWNETGTALYITIRPPFWGTWSFRVAVILGLVVLAITVYHQRIKAYEKRGRELELLVDQRTQSLQEETEQRIKAESALREREMEKAISDERNRLARELHDSVTQSLYSATLLAEAGQRVAGAGDLKRSRSYLERLVEISLQALKEMRLMIYELRPEVLERQGLEGALQERLEAVERRAGVDARMEVIGALELPKEIEANLYRIAQEALNNMLKHSGAKRVQVSLQSADLQAGKNVSLTIEDNGVGFDAEALSDRGGMGFASMHERVDQMGGTLSISSQPGEGTIIDVKAPLPRRDSDGR
jgi:signal transduction histidine kinase